MGLCRLNFFPMMPDQFTRNFHDLIVNCFEAVKKKPEGGGICPLASIIRVKSVDTMLKLDTRLIPIYPFCHITTAP